MNNAGGEGGGSAPFAVAVQVMGQSIACSVRRLGICLYQQCGHAQSEDKLTFKQIKEQAYTFLETEANIKATECTPSAVVVESQSDLCFLGG